MSEKITIAIILGTSREKRESVHAARFVEKIGRQQEGIEIIFVDPQDFTFPNDGNDTEGKDPKYTDIVAKADGYYIVTPEYNHSFPGALKRMLDSEYEHYFHKPVAVAGCSSGNWGGARVVESLLPVLRSLYLSAMPTTVYFPRVQDVFDDSGKIKPEHEARYTKSVQYAWKEPAWYARSLKHGRATMEL